VNTWIHALLVTFAFVELIAQTGLLTEPANNRTAQAGLLTEPASALMHRPIS
jgi:hypothetical protein